MISSLFKCTLGNRIDVNGLATDSYPRLHPGLEEKKRVIQKVVLTTRLKDRFSRLRVHPWCADDSDV